MAEPIFSYHIVMMMMTMMMMMMMMMNYVQYKIFVAILTLFDDTLIIKIIHYHRFVLNSSKSIRSYDYDSVAHNHISIIFSMVFNTIAMASASCFEE